MATENELGYDNIRDTHWLGEVVDNKDPLQNGRCRVRVFGKFDNLPSNTIPWASPSNVMTPGQHTIPRVGDIVSVVFDNGNIYLPTYSYHINQNKDLKKDVLSNAARPEDVISLIYDAIRNFRFYYSQEDGLILTTGVENHAAPMIRFSPDGKIFINSDNIFIASGWRDESEPAVKGETLRKTLNQFMESFINHTHLTPAGVPTSTPIPPANIQISTEKSKLQTIKQVKSASEPTSTGSNSNSTNGTGPADTTPPAENQNSAPSAGGTNTSVQQQATQTANPTVTTITTSTGETITYSSEDEILTLETIGNNPVSYAGIKSSTVEIIDDFDKNEGGFDTPTFYNGNATGAQKNAIIRSIEATHANGGSVGRCARYTFNAAKNYVNALRNKKVSKGALIPANGNANSQGYISALVSIGYRLINGGVGLSKSDIIKFLAQDYDIGDVVIYYSKDGSPNDSNKKFGHTQIFTGGLHKGSGGYKWSTDSLNNFRKNFVYKARSANNWNLLILKAPQA